jgi:DNA-binding transcriptional LysR family regulator
MDRLRLIETFVAVAKARSLSAAAKQIGCSRASVTKQIQDLESSLGASLLVRTTRKVLPTKLGEKYLDSCSKLLTDLSLADAAIRDAKQAVGGHLTVLLPRGFGDTFFVSAVTQFLVENPSVKLDLVFGDSASHKFGATDGDFDIAIRLWSIPRDSAIVAKKVGELKWTLCASSQFLKTAGPLRTPSDLKRVNCIIHTRFAPIRIWPFCN